MHFRVAVSAMQSKTRNSIRRVPLRSVIKQSTHWAVHHFDLDHKVLMAALAGSTS